MFGVVKIFLKVPLLNKAAFIWSKIQ